jgi:hypothetical protein
VDRPPCTAAPVHLCRHGDADRHRRSLFRPSDADRHIARGRHPCDLSGLAVRGAGPRRDGAALHWLLRARSHDDCRWHRAHREPVTLRGIGDEGLLPSRYENGDGECAGHRNLADVPQVPSGGRDSAACRQLQRFERSDPSGIDSLGHALRAAALRPHEQLSPDGPRHGAGSADARFPTAASSAR